MIFLSFHVQLQAVYVHPIDHWLSWGHHAVDDFPCEASVTAKELFQDLVSWMNSQVFPLLKGALKPGKRDEI